VECLLVDGLGREIRPLADLLAGLHLYRLMRRFDPHLVHTHTAKAGLLGRLAAIVAGVPVRVHTFHGHVLRGYFSPRVNALFRWIEAWLAGRTHALVAVSDAVKRDLVALGVTVDSKIRVIPLGLELGTLSGTLPRGRLRLEAGVPSHVPLVGCVGRLAPIKDLRTFLAAAARLRTRLPEVRFALVGDGEERGLLEECVARAGLKDCVHFHGWKYDMADVYGDLDVVVNSSLNEGTPVALIEALAAARPVVATAVGGTPDLLAGGAHGLLVPPGQPETLADAILTTLREPQAAAERARAGQAYVLARHTRERLLADVDALYRELLPASA
jgi:glycosyltransferase involved in cell wall biosynthesis